MLECSLAVFIMPRLAVVPPSCGSAHSSMRWAPACWAIPADAKLKQHISSWKGIKGYTILNVRFWIEYSLFQSKPALRWVDRIATGIPHCKGKSFLNGECAELPFTIQCQESYLQIHCLFWISIDDPR